MAKKQKTTLVNADEQNLTHLLNQATEKEERYQAFISNSNEGIWRYELKEPIDVSLPADKQIDMMYEHGYLAEANNVMAAMYGFDSTEPLIGADLGSLVIREDPDNIAYLKAFIASGYRLSGTESHEKDKDGNSKYFSNSLVGIVKDGYLQRAWGTQQDVTQQHKDTTALKRSEERLAFALKASGMGTWEWDIKRNILTWSDELKRLYGLPLDASITLELYQNMVHTEDRKVTRKIVEDALITGSEYRIEHRISWPDGSTHWILGQGQAIMRNGKAVKLVGTASNIDQQKESENALRTSEERFRTIADSSPLLIWESNTDNKLTYVNKAWQSFRGKSFDDCLRENWVQFIHLKDRDKFITNFLAARDKKQSFSAEIRMQRKDKTYRWILVNGIPRFAPDNSFLGYVGSSVDIHEVKRSQKLEAINETLKNQKSQLVALNESKGEFISLASHQLRTPATGVKQYLGMLLDGYSDKLSEQQRAFMQIAYDSNERQLTIIDDLLQVAQVDADKVALEKSDFDLVDLVNEVMKEQQACFKERKQSTEVISDNNEIMVTLDAPRMRMVLDNLIDNASKYSRENAHIVVTISQSKDTTSIAISDDGVGIHKKDIDKLFQKFSRIDNPLSAKVGGTGIGLYWAKRVVSLHGGSIKVESTTGKGSVFTILIPRTKK